ncbi:MAG: response regulator [Phycisphaeraceae bacterium]
MASHKVIVVDDERHITKILAFRLKQLGLEVLTAFNGKEALDLIRAERPSLVVSDYQMPLMSGLELAVALAQEEATAETPVIMLTARSHRLSHSEMVSTNIRTLLDKPLSGSELDAAVRETLGLEEGSAAAAA